MNKEKRTRDATKELGDTGEEAFRNWLDQNELGHIAIDQSPNTFAKAFRGIAKRPDFIVFTEEIGDFAVDVKNCNQRDTRFRTINLKDEYQKALEFERRTGKAVYYAFYVDESSWAWIRSKSAMTSGKVAESKAGTEFLSIRVESFELVRTREDLEHMLQAEHEIELCCG